MNEITNKKGNNQGKNTLATLSLSVDDFNNHYADISTDTNYVKPTTRTANLVTNNNSVDEITVFRILDTLKMSSSGPDGIPSLFLRLAAPVLARSLAHVYSLSISSGIVPKQWKGAIITPVEKINNPLGVTDFRPISVTSILSRKLEHIIVNKHIYPAMLDPPRIDILGSVCFPTDRIGYGSSYSSDRYCYRTASIWIRGGVDFVGLF